MIDTTTFASSTYGSYPQRGFAITQKTSSSGNIYAREAYYVSDTQIKFGAATVIGGTGSSTSALIPTSIVGLK